MGWDRVGVEVGQVGTSGLRLGWRFGGGGAVRGGTREGGGCDGVGRGGVRLKVAQVIRRWCGRGGLAARFGNVGVGCVRMVVGVGLG